MLGKFLSPTRILLDADASSMEDAVLLCGGLLVRDGCATPDYPAAMARTVEELGNSIVMAPYTALPHAAFTEGGLSPAVAAVRLDKPLDFGGSNGPVRLLLGFCGAGPDSHMEILAALALHLTQPGNIQALLDAKDPAEFLGLFKE